LVFLDEGGVTTTLTRLYGRAPGGERVPDQVPHGHWKVLTVLGALTINGVFAAMTVDAPTDAEIFLTFLDRVLCPTLRSGQVIVLDNLSAHKDQGVRPRIEACGCQLLYLPPYSSDLNPIELAWSKFKTGLRAPGFRSLDALMQGVGPGLATITPQDAPNFFRHCGYTLY
jgi:transposase